MGGPRFGRTSGRSDREQTAAMESGSTQEIFIPWDSEGLATPLQFELGVVGEELPCQVPGIYGCPIGQCRDATT